MKVLVEIEYDGNWQPQSSIYKSALIRTVFEGFSLDTGNMKFTPVDTDSETIAKESSFPFFSSLFKKD